MAIFIYKFIIGATAKTRSVSSPVTSKTAPLTSVEAFASSVRSAGISKYEDVLVNLCRNSIEISCKPVNEDELEIGESKIGGLPDLPSETAWPEFNNEPLSFIAQFRMSDTAKYDADHLLPETGMLYFFYDAYQQPWGGDPSDAGHWKVIYYNGDLSNLERREAPDTLPEEVRFKASQVAFSKELSLPPSESHDIHILDMSIKEISAYQDILLSTYDNHETNVYHRLLGHPDIIQDDMQTECQLNSNGINSGDASSMKDPHTVSLIRRSSDWRLLLQVDSDEDIGMMWGDAGSIYFWLPKDAFKSRDFDKTWVMLQCY
ncbi:MAG: YwqG family protein [Armatimonadota bacterium]